MSGKCFLCCTDCENTCDNCQLAFCSLNHLEIHKQAGKCSPWFVETKPGVGRIVLAARDIRPFELVMRDTDLLGMVMMDDRACVECGERKDLNMRKCDCGLERCKAGCSLTVQHECSKLQKLGIQNMSEKDRNALFMSLGFRRMIKLKHTNPEKWMDLMKLMSHREKRLKSKVFRKSLKRLRNHLNSMNAKVNDKNLLPSLQGILETNSHSFNKKIHHIFNSFSMISHSCIPNCEHLLAGKQALVRAKMRIRKGEEITIRYSDLCLHRDILKEEIESSWLFKCSCPRCSDSSELGTEASSLKCEKCGKGFVREYEDTKIYCNICNRIMTHREFVAKAQRLKLIERSLDYKSAYDHIPPIIKKMEETGGHPLYHSVIQLKIRFIEDIMDSLDNISSLQVIEYMKDVEKFMDVLNPGLSRLRGRLMSCVRKATSIINNSPGNRSEGDGERKDRLMEQKMMNGYFKC